MACLIMEAEKFQDLQLASWEPRRARGVLGYMHGVKEEKKVIRANRTRKNRLGPSAMRAF